MDGEKVTIADCLSECMTQFNSILMSMTHITNILFDFVNEDVQVSRSEVLPRILQLVKEINRDKLKAMCEDLSVTHRSVFASIADRFAECEQTIYTNMNKVADLRHTDEQKQAMQIVALKKLLEEKDKQITSLKTSENVTLWQKEKARILKQHNETIRGLEAKVEEVQAQKESLKRKLEDQGDALKMEKLRVEITKKRSSANFKPDESDLAMLEDLKRKVYLFDKDLMAAEKELVQFQSDMLGMMGGMQVDINAISEKTSQSESKEDLKRLSDTIDKIKCAVAGDTVLQVVRADLSESYLASKSNLEFFVTNHGKKVVVKPMRVRRHDQLSKKQSLPPLSNPYNIPDGQGRRRSSRQDSSFMGRRDSNRRRMSKAFHTDSVANPKLIDDSATTLDGIAVLKHFPTLSSSYVKDQWDNFKKYDTDHNGELDMSEIMSAITGIMPNHVKPIHIEAAVREIDIDGSGTLDFYEYLQLAMMLERKKGKSELFHTADVAKYNKQISKTCSVQ